MDPESAKSTRIAPTRKEKSMAVRALGLIKKSVRSKTALGKISSDPRSDPFRVLISTILSARTRDPVTESASERLFSHYPDANSLSKAPIGKVAELIKPVAFYNHKAPNIVSASDQIVKNHGGQVPKVYEELLALPGVGRKTANCVLVYGFCEPAIPVDVHVHRISNRIGLVKTKTPEETEEALASLYDRRYWLDVNELMVSFGQTTCKPIKPRCDACLVRRMCKFYLQERNKK
ncbi:MAG: endonuclease III [Thaumarchaeota archaeon]|nr:endonuclease III [Nitrososphaerota archaeon]